MITRFQQAVLQEMGIPVWIAQADAKSESEPVAVAQATSQPEQATPPSPRRSENSSSHLAALRKSISGEKSSDEVPPSEMSPSEASSGDNRSPALRALSPEEREHPVISDISLAYELVGVPQPAGIEVGEELSLSQSQLVLPASPLSLSAADKKRIWASICGSVSA